MVNWCSARKKACYVPRNYHLHHASTGIDEGNSLHPQYFPATKRVISNEYSAREKTNYFNIVVANIHWHVSNLPARVSFPLFITLIFITPISIVLIVETTQAHHAHIHAQIFNRGWGSRWIIATRDQRDGLWCRSRRYGCCQNRSRYLSRWTSVLEELLKFGRELALFTGLSVLCVCFLWYSFPSLELTFVASTLSFIHWMIGCWHLASI